MTIFFLICTWARLFFFPFFGLVRKFLLKFYVWNCLGYFNSSCRFHLYILVLILVYLIYLALIFFFSFFFFYILGSKM